MMTAGPPSTTEGTHVKDHLAPPLVRPDGGRVCGPGAYRFRRRGACERRAGHERDRAAGGHLGRGDRGRRRRDLLRRGPVHRWEGTTLSELVTRMIRRE